MKKTISAICSIFFIVLLSGCITHQKPIDISDNQTIPISIPLYPEYQPCKMKSYVYFTSPKFKFKMWFTHQIKKMDDDLLVEFKSSKMVIGNKTLQGPPLICDGRYIMTKYGELKQTEIASPYFTKYSKMSASEIATMFKDTKINIAKLEKGPIKSGDIILKTEESGFIISMLVIGFYYHENKKMILIRPEVDGSYMEMMTAEGYALMDPLTFQILESEMILKYGNKETKIVFFATEN